MSVFDFANYKLYVLKRISQLPSHGRGEFRRISVYLRLHPTMISQIFKGDKNLSREQALELCVYWGLSALESEYFLLLVDFGRAGSARLKAHTQNQIDLLKAKSLKLVNRIPSEGALTAESRAIFYSNWAYSGIRLATSIDKLRNIDAISRYFGMPNGGVARILEFLVESGLCFIDENHDFRMAVRQTHLEADSPLVQRHHANWRLKAMHRHENLTEAELCYTGPMSLSFDDFGRIRELLVQLVQQTTKIAKTSEEQMLGCLNIDWFKF